jgi:TolB-like protein
MPDKLSQFWNELKRRNVIRVITVYAGAAFVLLELVDMITEPFGLPAWTFKLAIVILSIGFVVAVILSWIYDVHPEGGVVRTVPSNELTDGAIPGSSNGWKIASYVSFIVIVGLIVLNVFPRSGREESGGVLEKSIAVLPFLNESSDQENTYFINGIMESILDNLSRIEDLRIVSRNTVEQYRNHPKPTPVVAEEMNVSYVLEGSGQKVGNRLLLTVQLIIGKEDRHIWSTQYDRVIEKVEDLIDLQKEIAQLIAGEIEAIITPEELVRIEKIPTSDTDAYDLYLKGIQGYYDYWATGRLSHIHQTIEYFMKAIEIDPDYSLAYTGLGRAYWMLGAFDPNRSPSHYEESKRLLRKAILLDPENGWAYAELGVVLNDCDWDSTASRIAMEKALQLSPNRSDVYDHYVHLAARMNDCEKLAALMREIKKRFNPDVDQGLAYFNLKLLTCREEYEIISRIADREWDKNTNILQTNYVSDAYIITGDYGKAMEVAEYMIQTFTVKEYGISAKGVILGLSGDEEGALSALTELEILSESRDISKVFLAGITLALGDVEKTQEYLEKALVERDGTLHEIEHAAPFYMHKNEPWLMEIIDRSWIPSESSNLKIDTVE